MLYIQDFLISFKTYFQYGHHIKRKHSWEHWTETLQELWMILRIFSLLCSDCCMYLHDFLLIFWLTQNHVKVSVQYHKKKKKKKNGHKKGEHFIHKVTKPHL
jgi:hypothetical protein